ncbi:hypothetical protein [Agarilytica rhodophyticola]|uniref:hypothetical protein n=1 Tax=Agarilytica rhodophyticola TaxID=1737490 RepID=UPI000B3475D9|nr:hypothetical protein [Agarilytica rhodophyticola]
MIEQFKTINDISAVIKEYEGMLRLRPTRKYSHPTLYRNRDVPNSEKLIMGVRVKDWFFSENKEWVLPHNQMGLSFSSTYKNLKSVYKLKEMHSNGARVDVYWTLERPDLPSGFKFVADQKTKGHYFLTVTEPMLLETLIDKLRVVARQMSKITGYQP